MELYLSEILLVIFSPSFFFPSKPPTYRISLLVLKSNACVLKHLQYPAHDPNKSWLVNHIIRFDIMDLHKMVILIKIVRTPIGI